MSKEQFTPSTKYLVAGKNLFSFNGIPDTVSRTREQQEARLKELRADPRFQKPWDDDQPPVCLEGGARCDDVFRRIHEKEQKVSAKPTS